TEPPGPTWPRPGPGGSFAPPPDNPWVPQPQPPPTGPGGGVGSGPVAGRGGFGGGRWPRRPRPRLPRRPEIASAGLPPLPPDPCRGTTAADCQACANLKYQKCISPSVQQCSQKAVDLYPAAIDTFCDNFSSGWDTDQFYECLQGLYTGQPREWWDKLAEEAMR